MGQCDRGRQETKQVSEFKQCPKEGTVAQSTGGLRRQCRAEFSVCEVLGNWGGNPGRAVKENTQGHPGLHPPTLTWGGTGPEEGVSCASWSSCRKDSQVHGCNRTDTVINKVTDTIATGEAK